MPEILIWGLVFIGTLIVLVKSADWFVDAAEEIGLVIGLPSFLVGLTIVALGTSIPELASSLVAVQKGSSEIVVSNVMGSNITNVFLVLGSVLLITSISAFKFTLKLGDVLMLVGSAGFLIFACLNDTVFTRPEAIVCFIGVITYCIFQYWNYLQAKKKETSDEAADRPPFRWQSIALLAVSLVGIKYSAEYNIEAIIKLSDILNIGKEIISVSAVALGTSLPELLVSLSAARRGNIDIAMGNLLGSNVLNIFAVMGIPGLLSNLSIPPFIMQHGLYLLAMATIGLLLILITKRFDRWIGVVFLGVYCYFLVILILEQTAAA